MKTPIIGFSAKKLGGKTTAVKDTVQFLRERGRWNVDQLAFAQPLKETLCMFLDLDITRMDDDEYKQTVHTLSGLTVRELLVDLGTRVLRRYDPDCHCNAWAKRWEHLRNTSVDPLGHLTLVPDVRFPNEVRTIQALGGVVIRLLRDPTRASGPSESDLDEMTHDTLKDLQGVTPPALRGTVFDAVVDNTAMSIDQQCFHIRRLLTERKWV